MVKIEWSDIEDHNRLFYLMHGNDKVISLNINTDTGSIIQTGSDAVPELLPPGGMKSREELVRWWNRRAVPVTRKGIAAALEILHLDSVGSLLVSSLGLSLTDHYWIKPYDSDLTWSDVNLYENTFSDSIGSFQFTSREEELQLYGKTMFSPSSSLQGDLKKKWVIGENEERYLIKGNYGFSCQQSLNEILASRIHRMQNRMPYTEYHLTELDTSEGRSIGCTCKNFANISLEFIPAVDILFSEKKKNDISDYEFFIQVCQKHGLEEKGVREFLEYQILSDFLITNVDRHFNNFGIIRDAITLQFVSVAPVFDSGNSMFWNMQHINPDICLTDIQVNSFRKKEIQLLRYIRNRNILDLAKLPDDGYIRNLYQRDENMPESRIENLITLFRKKRQMVEQFQLGKSLAPYPSRRYKR